MGRRSNARPAVAARRRSPRLPPAATLRAPSSPRLPRRHTLLRSRPGSHAVSRARETSPRRSVRVSPLPPALPSPLPYSQFPPLPLHLKLPVLRALSLPPIFHLSLIYFLDLLRNKNSRGTRNPNVRHLHRKYHQVLRQRCRRQPRESESAHRRHSRPAGA